MKLLAYRKFAIRVPRMQAKLQTRSLHGTEARLPIYVCLGIFSRGAIPARSAAAIFRDVHSLGTRGCLRRYGSRHLRSISMLYSNTPIAAEPCFCYHVRTAMITIVVRIKRDLTIVISCDRTCLYGATIKT